MSNIELTEADIREVLGEDAQGFIDTLEIVQDMIDHPSKFTGQRAITEAIRISAYRTKFGSTANWLKSQDKSILTRRKKDLLISMENNLLENINCLKLAGRVDAKFAGII